MTATQQTGIEDVLPLSPMQEGLLFHALYDDQTPDVYTVQLALDLKGHIDPAALRSAAEQLVRRHATLRVAFRSMGRGQSVQVVPRVVEVPWQEVDLSGLPVGEQEAQLESWLEQDRALRFDLGRPPLLRFALVRRGVDRHCLVFTCHHILLDGWSVPLLLKELLALYESRGDDSRLPRVTPYRNYLAWLAGQDRHAAELAWKTAFEDFEEPTLMASSSPDDPAVLPQYVRAELSPELTEVLSAVARKHRLTLNTVVQGAWGLLLGRLTGRDDVVFGATVSGRPPEVAGIESMIGLFINTIPVRVTLDPAESLIGLLKRIQDQQAELMDYQHLGLARVQALLGNAELFDTLVAFENYPLERDSLPQADGLHIAAAESRDATHYPVTLAAIPGPVLQFRLDYNPHVFTHDEAHQLLGRLQSVLSAVAFLPEQPTGRLDVLVDAERDRLLHEWNPVSRPVPSETVIELFEAQAKRTPDAVAVLAEAEELSYGELDARANRLAHALIERGIGPEDLAVLALPRTADLIVTLLAVLKTGAAYLPLDLKSPPERIDFVLQDAAPTCVITTHEAAHRFPEHADVIALDSRAAVLAIETQPAVNPTAEDRVRPLTPLAAAYVIYTSGSTGVPKGVVVEHQSFTDLVTWATESLGAERLSHVLAATSLTFDVSVFELFPPLTVGGTVELVPDILALADRPHWNGSLISGVPSALGSMLNQAELDITAASVVLAGEALSAKTVNDIRAVMPDCEVINAYGPTEATVYSTLWKAPTTRQETPPPIGRPLDNTRVYVLDWGLRPVPPGTVGELYLAGPGVA
ncbi:condensation domain-containing protein, partial [Streptomyces sp. NPDC058728]|uniref:non-ribosomal peptide synthetase n=2 Tax=Streptomyces TaxID=1883 RepID=UPI00365C6A1C